MTEEHKQRIKEGRERARQERLEQGLPLRQKKSKKVLFVNDKPILTITGNEETGFDFWKAIRLALRPIGRSKEADFITREIVRPEIWQNVPFILRVLETHFHIETEGEAKARTKKERKERKPRKVSAYVMTEEHKAKLKAAREAKKLQKSA